MKHCRTCTCSQTCEIEGCNNASYSRGWCQKHYMRWYTHGDPLFLVRPALSDKPYGPPKPNVVPTSQMDSDIERLLARYEHTNEQ